MLVGKEPLAKHGRFAPGTNATKRYVRSDGCFRGKSGPDVLDMSSSRLTPQPIEALLPIVVYAPALDAFL
jgi:hypothetical protein